MTKTVNVGMVGTKFMGRAHSNGYHKIPYFFDKVPQPILKAACATKENELNEFIKRYGWESGETSWERLVERDDIDLVDISTPNKLHRPVAMAAIKAGKHVLCEKPMAMNTAEALEMYEAAETAGIVNMMIFNYRFVPALAFAKKLIDSGKLGKIYHFNAVYLQDWLVDPQFPMVWRHNAAESGSGAHGDLNAHIIDLARFLVGEFEAVSGVQEVFVKERPLADGSGTGKVTVDDATLFMAKFQNGALGSFNASRFATGLKNFQRLEIFGSEGSLTFNLERLNELNYFSRNDAPGEQGFRNIMVTESNHPYVDAWWPPGHIIGWEHTFVHQFSTLMEGIGQHNQVTPSFYDGLRCQQVLDGVLESAKKGSWVSIPEK